MEYELAPETKLAVARILSSIVEAVTQAEENVFLGQVPAFKKWKASSEIFTFKGTNIIFNDYGVSIEIFLLMQTSEHIITKLRNLQKRIYNISRDMTGFGLLEVNLFLLKITSIEKAH